MSEFKLTTPVAFIIFNRPDTTERVFAEIAKARPPKLLVVGDGPRTSRPGEADRVAATRAIIEKVDWPCEILTNFSDINLGCKKRVSSGIDWVFDQVEEAIILEDDCLPEPTFFRFCQEMLEQYRQDQLIGMISGDNFQFGRRYGNDSYYFSKYAHIWGWATWRDRWVGCYDVEMKTWPHFKQSASNHEYMGKKSERRYWGGVFERVYKNSVDTWDVQWTYANWVKNRLIVLPQMNLISNIGFSMSATHTKSYGDMADMQVKPMVFPLMHPAAIVRNVDADARSDRICIRLPIWKRVRDRLKVLFK